jgi:hypothetical protein
MNTTSSDAQSQIAPPPRAVSARVRRRAWSDPIARFFLLSGIALALIAMVFSVIGINAWRSESQLIRRGVLVDAQIHTVMGIARPGYSADPSNPVTLQFPWQSQPYTTHQGRTLDKYDHLATVGDAVRVRVDPRNPENWTSLPELAPLHEQTQVMDAILILPAALAVFVAAAWRRRGLVRLWQHGIATPSLVVSSSISALSPLGRAVRCTPVEEGDLRVFTVYLQRHGNPAEPGETIHLLVRPAPSQRAVAVEFFA